MKGPRFTIGALVGLVALCGVGFAALLNATDWWDSGVFTLALLTYAIAAAYLPPTQGDHESLLGDVRSARRRLSRPCLRPIMRVAQPTPTLDDETDPTQLSPCFISP